MFTSVRPTPPPEGSLRGWCSACDLLKQISPLSSSPKQTPALLFTLAYFQSSESDLCYVKELGKGEGGVQEKCIHLRLESEAQASVILASHASIQGEESSSRKTQADEADSGPESTGGEKGSELFLLATSRDEWTQVCAHGCHHKVSGLCLRHSPACRSHGDTETPEGSDHST